jgi:hypothetical protein
VEKMEKKKGNTRHATLNKDFLVFFNGGTKNVYKCGIFRGVWAFRWSFFLLLLLAGCLWGYLRMAAGDKYTTG